MPTGAFSAVIITDPNAFSFKPRFGNAGWFKSQHGLHNTKLVNLQRFSLSKQGNHLVNVCRRSEGFFFSRPVSISTSSYAVLAPLYPVKMMQEHNPSIKFDFQKPSKGTPWQSYKEDTYVK